MKNSFFKTWGALIFSAAASFTTAANASAIIADWNFAEAANTKLHQTGNDGSGVGGSGGSWNVGITGLATDGAGLLKINNDGKGGSGTRSSYADFGPNFDQVTSGMLSLYTRFTSWNPARLNQNFTLGFIEGNDFGSAEFSFAASSSGFDLSGNVDGLGDGTALSNSAHFNSFRPLTVRLDVNLDLLSYMLSYDTGSGFLSLGSATIDSMTQGINSLRLGLNGDFINSGLMLDRIWVVETDSSEIPEPSSIAIMFLGLFLLVLFRRRAR